MDDALEKLRQELWEHQRDVAGPAAHTQAMLATLEKRLDRSETLLKKLTWEGVAARLSRIESQQDSLRDSLVRKSLEQSPVAEPSAPRKASRRSAGRRSKEKESQS